jgi:hypothetical protein
VSAKFPYLFYIFSLPADNTYATQNQLLPSSSQSFSAQSSAAGSQMSPKGQFIQEHRVLKQIDIIRLNKVNLQISNNIYNFLPLYMIHLFYYYIMQDEIVITVVTTSHLRPLAEDGTFLDAVAVLNKLLAKHCHMNAKSQNTKLKFLYSGYYNIKYLSFISYITIFQLYHINTSMLLSPNNINSITISSLCIG